MGPPILEGYMMSTTHDRNHNQESPLEEEINTERADRRSFLTKAIGSAGVMALLGMSVAGCEKSSDRCDSDYDEDPTDEIGGDPCDSD